MVHRHMINVRSKLIPIGRLPDGAVLGKGGERIALTDAVTTVKTYPSEKLLAVNA